MVIPGVDVCAYCAKSKRNISSSDCNELLQLFNECGENFKEDALFCGECGGRGTANIKHKQNKSNPQTLTLNITRPVDSENKDSSMNSELNVETSDQEIRSQSAEDKLKLFYQNSSHEKDISNDSVTPEVIACAYCMTSTQNLAIMENDDMLNMFKECGKDFEEVALFCGRCRELVSVKLERRKKNPLILAIRATRRYQWEESDLPVSLSSESISALKAAAAAAEGTSEAEAAATAAAAAEAAAAEAAAQSKDYVDSDASVESVFGYEERTDSDFLDEELIDCQMEITFLNSPSSENVFELFEVTPDFGPGCSSQNEQNLDVKSNVDVCAFCNKTTQDLTNADDIELVDLFRESGKQLEDNDRFCKHCIERGSDKLEYRKTNPSILALRATKPDVPEEEELSVSFDFDDVNNNKFTDEGHPLLSENDEELLEWEILFSNSTEDVFDEDSPGRRDSIINPIEPETTAQDQPHRIVENALDAIIRNLQSINTRYQNININNQ